MLRGIDITDEGHEKRTVDYGKIRPDLRITDTWICAVSLKIKRFCIFNRFADRSLGDLLVEKVYEVLDNYLEEDEYIAQIHLDYYNILMHYPEDYDEFFHRIIEMNRVIRDMPFEPFHGKIFQAWGVFPLPQTVDFISPIQCGYLQK